MIVRFYVTCSTCSQPHAARIQIGAGPRQDHSFPCVRCKQIIKVALDIDQKNVGWQFHTLENCAQSEETEAPSVYLSSDFVAESERIHDEMYFGSFDFLRTVIKTDAGKKLLNGARKDESFTVIEGWAAIEKIWRLEDAGQFVLSSKLNADFAHRHGLSERTFRENLWAFINSVFRAEDTLREQMVVAFKKNKPEFLRFLHFYQTQLRQHHRRSELNILNEYFGAFQEHSQVFAYVRMSAELPKSARATSIDFKRVKSFYALAFEYFASQLCILTCLNNILQGRPFYQLEKISLAKYMETDKAKRTASISGNPVFETFVREFDSKIRNASDHNWFFLKQDNTTIEYRSGGAGALNEMTYTDYLYRCGRLAVQICNLLILELTLDQIACETACINVR